jgi:hypothetical protein
MAQSVGKYLPVTLKAVLVMREKLMKMQGGSHSCMAMLVAYVHSRSWRRPEDSGAPMMSSRRPRHTRGSSASPTISLAYEDCLRIYWGLLKGIAVHCGLVERHSKDEGVFGLIKHVLYV